MSWRKRGTHAYRGKTHSRFGRLQNKLKTYGDLSNEFKEIEKETEANRKNRQEEPGGERLIEVDLHRPRNNSVRGRAKRMHDR